MAGVAKNAGDFEIETIKKKKSSDFPYAFNGRDKKHKRGATIYDKSISEVNNYDCILFFVDYCINK